MAAQQTFENHAKVVPAYHYFTFGLIAVYLVYRLYIAATGLLARRADVAAAGGRRC